ncbi:hypothetical protein Ana3638_23110 [Anaerocolumna sedimenticola]|uniref:Uncharacterized protein n=1 Tax=Anaerocolumna sedimenticola TaxID=2696063 RepID=A0A6P1TUE5_9FIRM|nr:class I SAM-dependent methyltransferase [Anaerocolumna sedimenticola]QHQ63306.1 hypothetical protein Ana3638_23110 [Anaerocolumna sedimenticola]
MNNIRSCEKEYHVIFHHYDGEMIPFEDETFDVVIVWSQTFEKKSWKDKI